MFSLPDIDSNVKEISPGAFSHGGRIGALLESNSERPPCPSGESAPVLTVPFCNTPDGFNAINSPATDEISTKTASNAASDVSPGSSPASVGLFKEYVNCDLNPEPEIMGILDAFRQHRRKLEGSPCTFLHLKHRQDGSTALYRVNACSCSRYFQQGRAQMIKNISQRLSDGQMSGVFFTLTVDAKRYSLTDAWPSMWPQFKRFKDASNVYRKKHMNASASFRYLAALEPHESDFPHLHVYCPGLRWLIKRQDLAKMDEWWGMGSVNTEKERRQDSARSYILKYVSKMDGWSELSMALVWHFRIRIYNLSHRKESYTGECESEWEWLASYRNAEDLSEGLGISFKKAEAIIEAWADCKDNLVYLS
jgi:hypothetical protein